MLRIATPEKDSSKRKELTKEDKQGLVGQLYNKDVLAKIRRVC